MSQTHLSTNLCKHVHRNGAARGIGHHHGHHLSAYNAAGIEHGRNYHLPQAQQRPSELPSLSQHVGTCTWACLTSADKCTSLSESHTAPPSTGCVPPNSPRSA